MIGTDVGRRIAAPIDIAWSTLADVGAYPGLVRSYVRVDYLTPGTTGVGTTWRQTRTVFGREHTQELRVVAWESPRHLATVARESGATYTTTHRLVPLDGATEVSVRVEVEATNVLGTLVQRLLGRRLLASTREAMERDLADLAAAAERRAAG